MSWFKRNDEKKANHSNAPAPETREAEDLPEDPPDDMPPRAVPSALADLFLVMEEHLNELEREDIQALADKLQQPPQLVQQLSSGLDEPEELREAILSSPSLSADVLRVVNSAAFALTSPISSIEHAVTYLGTNMVKGLLLQSAVSQVMKFETDVQKAAYMRIWRGSYIASASAQAYAQALDLEHPSVYATRALLAAVGDLALISARPDMANIYAPKSDLLTRIEAQQTEIMANSAVLSSILARQWQLPEDLFDALRHCLTPLTWPPGDNQRSESEQRDDVLVYLAGRVGDAVAYGQLKEVADFAPLASESPDFFYLHEYLRNPELGSLVGVLADKRYGGRVQRIIETFGQ